MTKFADKVAYGIVVAVCVTFIVWTVLENFLFHPMATSFLSHKTHLLHPLHVHSWTTVLHIHIAFACLAMITGATNFPARVWRDYRRLHRFNGYLVCVIAVCITSGYMAPSATGGRVTSIAFNVLNMMWIASTAVAFVQIKRKRVLSHRNWMIRSFVFCFTNLLIHVLMFIGQSLIGLTYHLSYTVSVCGGIFLIVFIAESVVRILVRQTLPAKGINLSQ